MLKRALISVFDKEGIQELGRALLALDFEILSTGGTAKTLREGGIPVTEVSEVTGFPEILGGRVKTLHPKIHGALLARPAVAKDRQELAEQRITPLDVLVCNLYPFLETVAKPASTPAEIIENIDIGGPAMLRAAAKNYEQITVVVDPADYGLLLQKLRQGGVDLKTKRQLAAKAFRQTAAYDALIAQYFTDLAQEGFPEKLSLTYELQQVLRYGENPQQKAAFYRQPLGAQPSFALAKQLQGKELSFNNINDANAAWQIVQEFTEPAAVAVKHLNPCGVGVGESLEEAFSKAFASDPVSIFGGIVALNRPVDAATAERLQQIFLEIVLAPSFSSAALKVLASKKNLRLLTIPAKMGKPEGYKLASVAGGLLLQEEDQQGYEDAQLVVVTERKPTKGEEAALRFAWKVVKHVKSNAIVVSGPDMTLGIGAGQMNRVGAAAIALKQAGERAQGAAMASDAFFPMDDTVELAAKKGITAIIQPGGSIRDEDSITKANEYGVAMVFTGVRHFKH